MIANNIYTSTCLGCLYLNQYFEDDWSDVTPGAGFVCRCTAGKFGFPDEIEAHETYKLIAYRQGCDSFELDGNIVKQAKDFEPYIRARQIEQVAYDKQLEKELNKTKG